MHMNVAIKKSQRFYMVTSLHDFYSSTNCSGRVNSPCWSWGSHDSVTIGNSCCIIILFTPWPVANGVSFAQFNHKHYGRLFCNLEVFGCMCYSILYNHFNMLSDIVQKFILVIVRYCLDINAQLCCCLLVLSRRKNYFCWNTRYGNFGL